MKRLDFLVFSDKDDKPSVGPVSKTLACTDKFCWISKNPHTFNELRVGDIVVWFISWEEGLLRAFCCGDPAKTGEHTQIDF